MQPAVLVSGLSRGDLAALERASPDKLAAAFRVSVAPEVGRTAAVAIAGRYAVSDGAVRFTPMYPLDPGRRYEVVFDSAATGASLARPLKLSKVVSIPTTGLSAPVRVAEIYPSGPTVPANLLRMYVAFSDSMGSRTGQEYIKILDARGREMPGALLPLDTDLWSGDHTRFTILFDPGRVKRGILPNRTMGRPLRPGARFTIVVGRDWPDAHGLPLASEFRKDYRVGPPIERALATEQWRITPPPAGTRESLRIIFPAPLDHGLLQRALHPFRGTTPIPGDVAIEKNETEWRFVPREPWTAGDYGVSVLPVLEDPSGNRIGHAFETLSPDDDTKAAPKGVYFTIR